MNDLTLNPIPDGKQCRKCGKVKPRSEFYAERRNDDGLSGRCSECARAYIRERRFPPREDGAKACNDCGERKHVSEFPPDVHMRDGLRSRCRSCESWSTRLARYGLTRAAFDTMLEAQGGRCAICRTISPPTGRHSRDGWHVDHDHTTGRIRGLLCRACNHLLGNAEDSIARLEAAIAYLARDAS